MTIHAKPTLLDPTIEAAIERAVEGAVSRAIGKPAAKKASAHSVPLPDDALMVDTNVVMRMTGLSRTSIWRHIRSAGFPKAVNMGERRQLYVRAEVEAWIANRIKQRDAAA
jgi:prophage regulatory protein